MAFNNGFPIGYQPYYPQNYVNYTTPLYQQPQTQQPVQTPIATQQPQNNGMTWVQGIGGAKSYLVAPNATVTLWDSEAPVIYLKSADASGMPSMKILDYTIRDDQTQNTVPPVSKDIVYATKEDIESIRVEMERFKSRIDSLQNRNYRNDRKDAKNE